MTVWHYLDRVPVGPHGGGLLLIAAVGILGIIILWASA